MVSFIGIDPGQSGGLSIHIGTQVTAFKFTNKTPMDIYQIFKSVRIDGCIALIERVASSPQMGRASAFTFGEGYGFLKGILTALEIPFEYVNPNTWQTFLKCRTGVKDRKGNVVRDKQGRPKHDKNVTKQKAQELFPHLKITHAIADALLIGEYLKRTHYKNMDLDLEL